MEAAAAGGASTRGPEVGDARDAVIDVSVTEVQEP
jgi:hypothetical protein